MQFTATENLIHLETAAGVTVAPSWSAIASLNRKLARVMDELETLHKDGRNKQQDYTYVTYSDVADAIRQAMARNNLALYTEIENVQQEHRDKGLATLLQISFTLADGDTGAMRTQSWRGEAVDYGMSDRGINKAITSAEKYWLMRTFLVSASDDAYRDLPARLRV